MIRNRLTEYRYKCKIRDSNHTIGAIGNHVHSNPCQSDLNSCQLARERSQLENDLSLTFAQVASIHVLLGNLKSDVVRVSELQKTILSTPTAADESKEELDRLVPKIKTISQAIRVKLNEMKLSIAKAEKSSGSSSVIRIKNTQYSALLRNFFDIMNEYQFTQTEYRDHCKSRIKRQLELVGAKMSGDEVEEMLEKGKLTVFTQEVLRETEQARQKLADVETRHNDIINLEKSLMDLHELFSEMALLVESQGAVVNSIEMHVSTTKNHVRAGRKKLAKARELRTGRKR